MKKIIVLLLINLLFSSEIYFMPHLGKKAESRLITLFTHAKKEIDIIIYTFTNKKLAKALKKAAKKGIKINIIADKKESKYGYSVIPNLASIKNIHVHLLSGKRFNSHKAKMHVKLAIIDDKYLITGSANYSYSAFYKNYEYIIIDKDKYLITKFKNFFKRLKKLSKKYRFSR